MTWGRGRIQAHPGTLPEPEGKGDTAGIIPGTDQEYIGHGLAERGRDGVFLTRHGDEYRYWESVPWGYRQRQGSRGQLADGESTGVDGDGENPAGGRPKSPAVRLCRTAEVTPTLVGIRAVVHPWNQRRLQLGETSAVRNLHNGPLPGPRRSNTRERCHTPTCETGGTGPPWSGVLCYHMTPRCRAQGPGRVTDGGPLRLPPRDKDGGAEAGHPAGGGGPGEELSGVPSPRNMSTVTSEKDEGMADVSAVHDKWDRTGCTGMARCHLPEIWPIAPRFPSLLQRLQRNFLHLPCPWLQAVRPCYGASQEAPWRGCGPGRKKFHPLSCAQQPPHLHRLRRE